MARPVSSDSSVALRTVPGGAGALHIGWPVGPPAADAGGAVVATGIFDLLHVGHLRFLQFARRAGSCLLVGVEDDARAHARKGAGRPLVPAVERAEMVAGLAAVDGVFVIGGPVDLWRPEAYAAAMAPLRPAAIALTQGDPAEPGKREAAQLLGAEVVVAPFVDDRSTTGLVERLQASV
jgi:cytidyltransferase-like protein